MRKHVWPEQLQHLMAPTGDVLATIADLMDWGEVSGPHSAEWVRCVRQLISEPASQMLRPPPPTVTDDITCQWVRRNHFHACLAHLYGYFCGSGQPVSSANSRGGEHSSWLQGLMGEHGWRPEGQSFGALLECLDTKLNDMCEAVPEVVLEAFREWLLGGNASQVKRHSKRKSYRRFVPLYPPKLTSGGDNRFKVTTKHVVARGNVKGIWGVPMSFTRHTNCAIGFSLLSDVTLHVSKVIDTVFGGREKEELLKAAALFFGQEVLQLKCEARESLGGITDSEMVNMQRVVLKTTVHCLLGWWMALPFLSRYVQTVQRSAVAAGLTGLLAGGRLGPLSPARMELVRSKELVQRAEQEGRARQLLPALVEALRRMQLENPAKAATVEKVCVLLRVDPDMYVILEKLWSPLHQEAQVQQREHEQQQLALQQQQQQQREYQQQQLELQKQHLELRQQQLELRQQQLLQQQQLGLRQQQLLLQQQLQQLQPQQQLLLQQLLLKQQQQQLEQQLQQQQQQQLQQLLQQQQLALQQQQLELQQQQQQNQDKRKAFKVNLTEFRAQPLSGLPATPPRATRLMARVQLTLFWEAQWQLLEQPQEAAQAREQVRRQLELLEPQRVDQREALAQPPFSAHPTGALQERGLEVMMELVGKALRARQQQQQAMLRQQLPALQPPPQPMAPPRPRGGAGDAAGEVVEDPAAASVAGVACAVAGIVAVAPGAGRGVAGATGHTTGLPVAAGSARAPVPSEVQRQVRMLGGVHRVSAVASRMAACGTVCLRAAGVQPPYPPYPPYPAAAVAAPALGIIPDLTAASQQGDSAILGLSQDPTAPPSLLPATRTAGFPLCDSTQRQQSVLPSATGQQLPWAAAAAAAGALPLVGPAALAALLSAQQAARAAAATDSGFLSVGSHAHASGVFPTLQVTGGSGYGRGGGAGAWAATPNSIQRPPLPPSQQQHQPLYGAAPGPPFAVFGPPATATAGLATAWSPLTDGALAAPASAPNDPREEPLLVPSLQLPPQQQTFSMPTPSAPACALPHGPPDHSRSSLPPTFWDAGQRSPYYGAVAPPKLQAAQWPPPTATAPATEAASRANGSDDPDFHRFIQDYLSSVALDEKGSSNGGGSSSGGGGDGGSGGAGAGPDYPEGGIGLGGLPGVPDWGLWRGL